MDKWATKEALRLDAAIVSSRIKPAELARICQVAPALIYQWRTGRRPVPAYIAAKVGEALGVPPHEISAAYAEVMGGERGNVVPLPNAADKDERRPDLIVARLENDIQALRMTVGALVAAMTVHRPAEASDVARVIRKRVPAKFQDMGLVAEVLAMLDASGTATKA